MRNARWTVLLLALLAATALLPACGGAATDEQSATPSPGVTQRSPGAVEVSADRQAAVTTAMMNYFLKDKPGNYVMTLEISNMQFDESKEQATAVIQGTAGQGAVDLGVYKKVGDPIENEPIKAVYENGEWVCSWNTP